MPSDNKSIVYVDIESILDIRQGFLFHETELVEELADYVLSDEYNYREMDVFEKFTLNNYTEAMKTPKKKFLESSLLTYLLGMMMNKLDGTERVDKFKGQTTIPELWFNVYPFELTEQEMEHIRELIFIKMGKRHFIEMVYIPPKDLTPSLFIEGNFIAAFIYDFSNWFTLHGEALQTNIIADCPLYFAPILKEKPTPEDLEGIKKTGFNDMFGYLECVVSPLARIVFLPMVFYSNVIVAQKHLELYHKRAKKEFSEMSEKIDIPEEFYDNGTSSS